MIFKSQKDLLPTLIIIGTVVLLLIILFNHFIAHESNVSFILILSIIALIIWFLLSIWFNTYYMINKHILLYRSGPLKGQIDINEIISINTSKKLWAGFKPALSNKGLVIRYKKYSEIYISPNNKAEFIDTLLKVNNKIEVIGSL